MLQVAARSLLGPLAIAAGLVASAGATQRVYVDFDTRTGPGDHVYTPAERDAIVALLEADFAPFDYQFTHAAAPAAPFARVFVNEGPPLGQASAVDFRNVDPGGTARVNVNSAASTSQQFITATANIVAHEVTHLAGVRHHDAFGPPGAGIDGSRVLASMFLPAYPGPTTAVADAWLPETGGAGEEATVDQALGFRGALKLAFNESGSVVAEAAGSKGSPATAQPIALAPLSVPDPAGGPNRPAAAVAVTGAIGVAGEADYYRFAGAAGDLLTVELWSFVLSNRYQNTFDSELSLFDATGEPVDYYGADAYNDNEPESTDSLLLDVVLPDTGEYFLRVAAATGVESGAYELFAYSVASNAPLPGDFNRDGLVDAADYTVWRDGLTDVPLDPTDYATWRDNFGAVPSATSTPEPGTTGLLLLAVVGALWAKRTQGDAIRTS